MQFFVRSVKCTTNPHFPIWHWRAANRRKPLLAIFGSSRSASSVFEYADGTIGAIRGARAREPIAGLVAIVQSMGVIAVCHGIHLLGLSARGGHGPRTFSPGITFLVAGAAATNFPLFVGLAESLITAP